MATLTDIAKAAGVSIGVVSRVINRDDTLRISRETRERVQKAIEDHDYAPNVAAQSLRSARSGLIAMVVHDVSNPVYTEILRGAQQAAAQSGHALLISDASGLQDRTSRLVQLIGGGGVDGLILQAAGGLSDLELARAASEKVPTVLLQAELDINAHLICLPDDEAAFMATEHLLDLGHRKIGCLATAEGLTFTRHRESGWRRALAEHNLACEPLPIVHGLPTIESGVEAAKQLYDALPGMSALVCFNVVAAIGAMDAADQLGLSVPDDLSIIALHDIALVDHLRVPLTTIAMPLFDMGRLAVERLAAPDFNAKATSHLEQFPPRLILRDSTARPGR